MRLLELDIASFRKFLGRVCIRLQPHGLTLLTGDNEEGKSSVLAALEAVLFESHRVGGQALEGMRPWTGGDPEISARFLLDGREWRIAKRFGRGAQARLFEEGRPVARDLEAERRLVELLRFEPRQGRAEARAEHRGLFGLFWLRQGTSFRGFEVPEALRSPLAAAIAAEIDDAAGGGRPGAVLDLARRSAGALLTSGQRRETGELRELAQALDAARQAADELDRRWQDVEQRVAELERLREEARRVARRDEPGEARRRLAGLEARKAEIDRLALEVERAQAVAAQRSSELRALEERSEARRQLRARLAATAGEQARLAEEMAATSRRFERAQAELAAATDRQAALDVELRALDERIAAQRRAAERQRLRHAVARAKADRARLAELAGQLAEIRAKLEAVRVTPELVEALRRATTEAAVARASLEAVATRLEFRPDPGRRVLRDGRELATDGPELVTEPAEFLLEGFGRLGVRPGAADLAGRQRQLAGAKARVAELLDAAGVAGLAEAEALLRRREDWAQEGRRLDDERRLLLERHEARSEAELDARIAGVAARLEELGEEEADEDAAPEDALARLGEEQRQKRADAAALASEVARLAGVAQDARVELARLEAEAGQLERRIAALREELAAHEAALPDDELQRRLAAAREAAERAAAEHLTLRRELERHDPAALAEALDRQRRRIRELEAEESRRRERIRTLEAELRATGGTDLAERLARARGEVERLERTYRAKRLEAEAWWLLVERLEAAQRSRREALTRPVVERTLPWLRRLFPDAGLGIDPDGLVITGLDRGGVREPFRSLSVGTREQLAVLVRLALAGLVGEVRGEPPCVVLDDALVYADEHRFEVMKGILERAARDAGMQILVLTCRPRDWLGIEAAFLRLEDCAAPLSG